MKKVFLSAAIVTTIILSGCKNEVKKTETTVETVSDLAMTETSFGVRGNCEMCKITIEKAAKSIEGVSNANWDVEKKYIDISFDASKTDALEIHKAIAASGYDTEKVNANADAYNALPSCCKYDHEMVMNTSVE